MGANLAEKVMLITPSSSSYGGGSRFAQYTPYAMALLRIVVAFLFVQHATAKFFGVPHVAALAGVQVFSLIGVAGIMELVGSALLLIGLWTRPTAFLLSGEMAVAYFMAHMPRDFFPVNNGGDLAISFCFIFLYLVFAGAGAFALDNRRSA